MFYSARGMAFFMGAYGCALLYSAVNLAFFEYFEIKKEWQGAVFILWLLFGLLLPFGIFRRNGLQFIKHAIKRVGGVALAFVLHFSAVFLFLNAWTILAAGTALDAPTSRAAVILTGAALLWIAYGVARAYRIAVRVIPMKLSSPLPRPPIRLVAVAEFTRGALSNGATSNVCKTSLNAGRTFCFYWEI